MRRKASKNIITILILLTLAFIWGNSVVPGAQSDAISDKVTESVGGEVAHTAQESAQASTWLTSSHIRKLAHVSEFAALGLEAVLFVVIRDKKIKDSLAHIALFGMSVAVIDETIQLFNDRTSAVKDVWIDLLGFTLGCGLMWFITYIIDKRKNQRGQA